MSEEIKVVKEEKTKNKKRNERAETFIGWKSEDDLLEVVGIHGKQGKDTTFRIICHKCIKDKELFPKGFFVSKKNTLIKGQKPCGCGRHPKWNKEQYLVLARRAAQGRFIVHGFSEEFYGQKSKIRLQCLVDNHIWDASLHSVINTRNGCPACKMATHKNKLKLPESCAFNKCVAICNERKYEPVGFEHGYKNNNSKFSYKCSKHGLQSSSYRSFVRNEGGCTYCAKEHNKRPEEDALNRCKAICKEEGYTPVGFVSGYIGAKTTIFEYLCEKHGTQYVRYDNFVNTGNRCNGCTRGGYNQSKRGSVYIVEWSNPHHSFIKFGITNNDVIKRIKQQSRNTNYTPLLLWGSSFEDGRIPKAMEDSIKSSIVTGIMTKEEFPDGYTETTDIENLNIIEDIILDNLLYSVL